MEDLTRNTQCPPQAVNFARAWLHVPMPAGGLHYRMEDSRPWASGCGELGGEYCLRRRAIFIMPCRPEHEMVETLFHEFVHHKQHLMGWLRTDGQQWFWKNHRAAGKGYDQHTFGSYENQPHERQARDVAARMLDAWFLGQWPVRQLPPCSHTRKTLMISSDALRLIT